MVTDQDSDDFYRLWTARRDFNNCRGASWDRYRFAILQQTFNAHRNRGNMTVRSRWYAMHRSSMLERSDSAVASIFESKSEMRFGMRSNPLSTISTSTTRINLLLAVESALTLGDLGRRSEKSHLGLRPRYDVNSLTPRSHRIRLCTEDRSICGDHSDHKERTLVR